MAHEDIITLAVLITLAFAWRFVRTRQMYLTSLAVRTQKLAPIPFKPRDLSTFVQQALLGRRSMEPNSFFIRGVVFVLVAVCILPLKNYSPPLWWLTIVLIGLYVPWCVAHGLILNKKSEDDEAH
ncbi:MAG TPA: hypothetical protein G4O08_11125 [Anaerolineae bacterium]|nr:hypothetical protein [Anaerolineae bacterium]